MREISNNDQTHQENYSSVFGFGGLHTIARARLQILVFHRRTPGVKLRRPASAELAGLG